MNGHSCLPFTNTETGLIRSDCREKVMTIELGYLHIVSTNFMPAYNYDVDFISRQGNIRILGVVFLNA